MTATLTRSVSPEAVSPTAPLPRRHPRRIGLAITLVVLTAIFVLPLVSMLLTSLTPIDEVNALDAPLLPQHPTIAAYSEILANDRLPVLRWLGNSLLTAVLHSALVVVVATTAAYALARLDLPFRNALLAVVLATMFVPGVIFLIPHFLMVNELGWLNSYASLVVPSAAGAFGVILVRQFFVSIDPAFEEAARIDGANAWQVFRRIMVPLAMPAVATLAVIAFLSSWNDFLWPVFVLFSTDMLTLPAGLAQLQGEYASRYDLLMAGAVIASVPVLLVYVFAQRYVIDGVSQGGVKG